MGCLRAKLEDVLRQELSLIVSGRHGFLFLNGVRVPISGGGFSAVTHIVSALHRMGLAGFSFDQNVSDADLLGMAELFRTESSELADWQSLTSITPMPTEWCDAEFGDLEAFEMTGDEDRIRDTSFQEVFLVRRLLESFGAVGIVSAVVAKGILQGIAEDILADPTLLAMVRDLLSRDLDEVSHAVDIAVTSTRIAVQLGLDHDLLREIGVAGLFYDMGRDRSTFRNLVC